MSALKKLSIERLEIRTALTVTSVFLTFDTGCVSEVSGDANCDGVFDSSDIVETMQKGEYEDDVANNSVWSDGDFNGDGEFTSGDLVHAFQESAYEPNAGHDCNGSSTIGDANCDGVFNSSDIVKIMQAGEFEDDVSSHFENNSAWHEGDFDGDGDFTSRDLIFAFQNSAYLG